jgi:arylsulfatase A-like enzyme
LSLNAPHTPVVAPETFAGSTAGRQIPPPPPPPAPPDQPRWIRQALREYQGSHRLSAEEIARARRYYYERSAFVDSQIGRLLDWLRGSGKLDNTIVALVSDHGAHLGDQGMFQKQTFYEQVVTVPYIFRFPARVKRGQRHRTPVTTLTLLPTLIELAGLQLPRVVETASLAPFLREGEEPAAVPVFSEIKLGYRQHRDDERIVMVRRGTHKLFLFPDGGDADGAFYDLQRDPGETKNRFADPAAQAAIAELRSAIARWDRQRRRG